MSMRDGYPATDLTAAQILEVVAQVKQRAPSMWADLVERVTAGADWRPTYNHTRGDSAATPCPVCAPDPPPAPKRAIGDILGELRQAVERHPENVRRAIAIAIDHGHGERSMGMYARTDLGERMIRALDDRVALLLEEYFTVADELPAAIVTGER